MLTVQLEDSGTVRCLHCDTVLPYAYDYKKYKEEKCECGNLKIHGITLTDLEGKHMYAVVPDFYLNIAKKYIFVDVDKTLCLTNEFPFLGKPNISLINILRNLYKAGYAILVYSCRTNPNIVGGVTEANWHREQILNFLQDNDIDWFMKIYRGIKPYGAFIVDDKATSYQALVSIMQGLKGFEYKHAMEESD